MAKFRPIPKSKRPSSLKGEPKRQDVPPEISKENSTNCDTFVVATTHLLYNPKRQDVKLAQLAVFFAELDRFAYKSQLDLEIQPPMTRQEYYYPCIVTGDFNLNPDNVIYNSFISGGHLGYMGLSTRYLEKPHIPVEPTI